MTNRITLALLCALIALSSANTALAGAGLIRGGLNISSLETTPRFSAAYEFVKIRGTAVALGTGYERLNNHNVIPFFMEVRLSSPFQGSLNSAFLFLQGGVANISVNSKVVQSNPNFLTDFEVSQQSLAENPLNNDLSGGLFGGGVGFQTRVNTHVQALIEMGVRFQHGFRQFTLSRDFPDLSTPPGTEPDRNSLRGPGFSTLFNVSLGFRFE